MANIRTRRGSGGNKKHGRNLAGCQVYRSLRKREKSHIRRITKHINFNPNDKQAKKALARYEQLLKS